jgi:hypothetical protein
MAPRLKHALYTALTAGIVFANQTAASVQTVDSCLGCPQKPYTINVVQDERAKIGPIIVETRNGARITRDTLSAQSYDRHALRDGVDTFCQAEDIVRYRLPSLSEWQKNHGLNRLELTVRDANDTETRILSIEHSDGNRYVSITRDELASLTQDENGYYVLDATGELVLKDTRGKVCQSILIPFKAVYDPSCNTTTKETTPVTQASPTPMRVRIVNQGTGLQAPPYVAQCSDGEDNDDDGTTDFPADPGCRSTSDERERSIFADRKHKKQATSRPTPLQAPPYEKQEHENREERVYEERVRKDDADRSLDLRIGLGLADVTFTQRVDDARESTQRDAMRFVASLERRDDASYLGGGLIVTSGGESGAYGGEQISASGLFLEGRKAWKFGRNVGIAVGAGAEYYDIVMDPNVEYDAGQQNFIVAARAGLLLGGYHRNHLELGAGVAMQQIQETYLGSRRYEAGSSWEQTPFGFVAAQVRGEKLYGRGEARFFPESETVYTDGLYELVGTGEAFNARIEVGGDMGDSWGWWTAFKTETVDETLRDISRNNVMKIDTNISSVDGGVRYRF